MGPGERKVAAVLTVLLIVLVAIYFVKKPTVEIPRALQAAAQGGQRMPGGPQATGASGPQATGGTAASCATGGPASAGGVKTQEFGKKGAKVEIVADLPITHGCHVTTEAQVKEAYKKFPNDVHLIVYDLFGPEGGKYATSHGGKRAMVVINGKTSFDLNGKQVTFEYTEDRYSTSDIVPVVEQEVKKS